MVSYEYGNLPGSHYYHFTPSEVIEKYYYYMVWCGHYYCKFGYDIKRSYYPPLLLVYVREGVMLLDYMEKHFEITKEQSFLIDCNFPHQYRSTDGLEFVYFHFDGLNSHELSRHLINANKSPVFLGNQSIKAGKIIYDTVTRYLNNQKVTEIECSKKIYEALCCLSEREILVASDIEYIKDAETFIRKNLDRQITLEEIAAHVNLSPYYFSRLFKAETGYSPIRYITKLRFELAKTFLKTTLMSIEMIAYSVGYSSSASFINAFVKNVGLSPNKFRKIRI